jgi:threonine dehydrogenase-like Zn-dependent dehydrogenase
MEAQLEAGGGGHIHTLNCACWHLTGPGKLEKSVKDLSRPLGCDEIFIGPRYNGHCESDVTVFNAGRHQSQNKEDPLPILLGHEPVGIVTQVGSDVRNLRVGDMVAVEPGIPCGECTECKSGRYNLCRRVKYMATPSGDWTYGCYARTIRWPARLCHPVPEGLNPMIAALTESMAAGRESVGCVGLTKDFKPYRETVVLVGAGQMAMNILLQLKRRWPRLKVVAMARKQADRDMATAFGADLALPLAQDEWHADHRLELLLEAVEGKNPSLQQIQETARAYRSAETHNHQVNAENVAAFKEARRFAGEEVACVLECTGKPHLFGAALEARIIRGDGSYGLVSCLYHVAFDMANLRRDGANVWNLRRSRNQFGHVLRELAQDPAYYSRLIGHVVGFEDIPELYHGKKGKATGAAGPKVMIEYN